MSVHRRTDVSTTVSHAVDQLIDIYESSTQLAREVMESGEYPTYENVVYPKLTVEIKSWKPIDRNEPFGYVEDAGRYSAVLSRPRMMQGYLRGQLERLANNYECEITVEPSDVRIPPEYISDIDGISEVRRSGDVGDVVPRPTLDDVDDAIIDGEWDAFHQSEKPLFHFTPQRFDIACARIEHYTGISVENVQRFILFTNYSMHTTEFIQYCLDQLRTEGSRYSAMVLGNGRKITRENAQHIDEHELAVADNYQMPRIDLLAEEQTGITMINIGVGPSNAKTITDCLAVLRPEAWVMIGHCAGLDGRMRMGDLILGNAYQRGDHILEDRVSLGTPIPAVPEIQKALEASVKDIYGEDLSLMRTGTVLTTDDRNWEWHSPKNLWEMLRGSTAAACDMESATLAANGYRYRVPYGSLLAVSDLPLHAVPKLPAAAQTFYANSKQAHVMCAVRAMERLAQDPKRLRTRKLRRTIAEVPFR